MPSSVVVTTPSDLEIRVSRNFDAPCDLVFAYHTKCKYVQQWLLGPPGWSMPECDIDLRVGGRYRYVWRNHDNGKEFGVSGEFREIAVPERMVTVESMDGVPGHARITTVFEKDGSGTAFAITIQFESKEYRDGALESGMTDGMSMSYDRLEETVATQP
jgi:uncharacterized protein YndB with AHSA1/START domain